MRKRLETWRNVVGFSAYEVSNLGRVRRALTAPALTSGKPGKILKPQGPRAVYFLRHDKTTFARQGSILVLEAFTGPKPSVKHEACHKDDVPTNNKQFNLYWGTRKQNMQDAKRNGTATVGIQNGHAALTLHQLRLIRASPKSGVILATELGLHKITIYRARRNETYREDH